VFVYVYVCVCVCVCYTRTHTHTHTHTYTVMHTNKHICGGLEIEHTHTHTKTHMWWFGNCYHPSVKKIMPPYFLKQLSFPLLTELHYYILPKVE